jgi:hypothetical protein
MFDFLGRPRADRRASMGPRQGRPITIGFEQLEGREMLSVGIAVTIAPSCNPPLPSMPRPIVGRLDPTDTGEARPLAVRYRTANSDPEFRWSRPWPLGRRSRFGL